MAGQTSKDVRQVTNIRTASGQTNVWFLNLVLGAERVQAMRLPESNTIRYECFPEGQPNGPPLVIDLQEGLDLEEKVSILRFALRIHNGNNRKGEESSHSST